MNRQELPQDIDAERCLLSNLANDGALDPNSGAADAHKAVLSLKPEHFMHPGHSAVLRAIQALYSECCEINPIAIKATMERQGTLPRVGGFTGLLGMIDSSEVVSKPSSLANRIIDLWRSRQVIKIAADAQAQAMRQSQDVQSVISDIAGRLATLNVSDQASKITSAADMLDRLQAKEAFRQPGDSAGKLAWLGIPTIDQEIEASPRHIVMIAARPGIGKSALAIQGLWETAKRGITSLLISLEMDQDEVDSRLASWRTREGHRQFRSGAYSDAAVYDLIQHGHILDRIKKWVHPSGVPWPTVEAIIRDAVRVHGVSTVWIDHVLLIQKPNLGRSANDAACWTAISHAIKRLAQELNVCIVGLCQLNRSDDINEPKLSSLKESGGWEEDANAVLMLWPKDPKSVEMMQESKSVMVKAAKNRSGAGGWKRELEFNGAFSRFREAERTTDAPVIARQSDLSWRM